MRVGSLIKLRPEYEERYIILHKYTFSGVLDRIRMCNIRNYSIYLHTGILFSYLEYSGDNFERDMARIGEDPVTQDWWKLTDPMQEPMESRREGEWWAAIDEVFHWERKNRPHENVRRLAFTTSILGGVEDKMIESLKMAYPILVETSDLKDIQSFSLFHKNACLYFYSECLDEDLGTAGDKFQASLKIEDELDWVPMKEVFHTD